MTTAGVPRNVAMKMVIGRRLCSSDRTYLRRRHPGSRHQDSRLRREPSQIN